MRYRFGEYELDTRACELRFRGEPAHLEPQVFDLLSYLLRNRDRLVTRREILEQIWGHHFVSESTLGSRLMSVRRAVGDDGRAQRVIRTLHGRGFRFIADVRVEPLSMAGEGAPQAAPPAGEDGRHPDDSAARGSLPAFGEGTVQESYFVGRGPELALLEQLLEETLRGARRTVFLSGEAGIGRTALLREFLRRVDERHDVGVALGQCLDLRGAGEPYLPLLEAFGRVARSGLGTDFLNLLRIRAPNWYSQIRGVADIDRVDRTDGRAPSTPERMLREVVEVLEAWTASHPLVLVLEDLHWSDPSTLRFVDWAARRRESAKLLVLATFRRGEPRAEPSVESLIRALEVAGLGTEIVLPPLTAAEVDEYLACRLSPSPTVAALAPRLHGRTEGNPLFVRSLVDQWLERAALELAPGASAIESLDALAAGVPESLRRLLDQQLQELSAADVDLLEIASSIGMDFAVDLVAGEDAAPERLEAIESRFQAFARQSRFVSATGPSERPDGTVVATFRFLHNLQRETLYERMGEGRRSRLHRQVGVALERIHGNRARQRAAELASHFVRGRDHSRSVTYLELAARQALGRGALHEAIGHLQTSLAILRAHPELPTATERELVALQLLGPALISTRGWLDPGAEAAFRRGCELAEEIGDTSRLDAALYELATVHEIRGEFTASQMLVERSLHLGTTAPERLIERQELLACSLFHQGRFDSALDAAEAGAGVYRAEAHSRMVAGHGGNPGVACHYWAGQASWFLGRVDTAVERVEAAIALAESFSPGHLAISPRLYAARLHQYRREPDRVAEHARLAHTLAGRHGYVFHTAFATILEGWARAATGDPERGTREIEQGLESHRSLGASIVRPYCLALLAEALDWADRAEEALAPLAEGLRLVHLHARSYFWEAELHRLQALIRLHAGETRATVEADCRRAIKVAREQGAVSLELRAALARANLVQASSRASAIDLVRRLRGRFTEGSTTPDLLEAHATVHRPSG